MARPMRDAAVKARELIARGFGVEHVDSIGNEGIPPEEEELLNDEIFACSLPEIDLLQASEQCEVGDDNGDVSAASSFRTYADIDILPSTVNFGPSRVPGPHLVDRLTRQGVNKFTRAVDFFQLFFDEEILQTIVDNTNIYGWLHILDKPSYGKKVDGSWEPVCTQEIKNMIALIIYLGFAGRMDIERNWSQATLYAGGWARRFLSRNRFKAINAMLHVSVPGLEDPNDKLTKVRFLLEHIKRTCQHLYQPHRAVSVDERMVKSKSRSPIRQYMPDKPTKFGYKLWCACDASCGYTYTFSVYTGKSTTKSNNGLGFDVVTGLTEGLQNQGYQIYCDNFFSSMVLAEHLLTRNTLMCGTMQSWRRHFPEELKDKTWCKKAKRGHMRYIRHDSVLFLQWMDKRPVTMISTQHKGHESTSVRRNGKDAEGKFTTEVVRIPQCVYQYNHCMGGVDLADQMIESYNCLVKCVRWWKTLLFHMVDLAIVNSFILFQQWRQQHPNNPALQRKAGYSHLHFREELVRQLANISDAEEPPIYTQPGKRKRSLVLTGPHDPEYTDTRRNCKVCYILFKKQIKSYIKCSDDCCNVHLCLNKVRNCFPIWHSREFDKYRTHRHGHCKCSC